MKELNEKRVQRIVKKLDNFRQSCKFFMTLLTNWSSYMKPSSPDDFILDEFHPLSHYCLKYAAFNFGFLLDILSSRECPKQMIATYDHDYWDNFLDTPEYVDLAKKTEDLKNQATKILTTFTEQNLAGYLTRKQKKLSDMKSVYNTDLTLDCSASLQGKLHEASLIIQKISSSKKKYFDELQKISVDLEFAKKILDDAYDNKTIILFEDYAKQRGNKDIKLSSFFTELPYLQ